MAIKHQRRSAVWARQRRWRPPGNEPLPDALRAEACSIERDGYGPSFRRRRDILMAASRSQARPGEGFSLSEGYTTALQPSPLCGAREPDGAIRPRRGPKPDLGRRRGVATWMLTMHRGRRRRASQRHRKIIMSIRLSGCAAGDRLRQNRIRETVPGQITGQRTLRSDIRALFMCGGSSRHDLAPAAL